jgi:hypothetical protein
VKNCVAAIFLLLCLTSLTSTRAVDFDVRAGIGYDVISQEFFLDSLTRTGVDSLDAGLTLSTTYLDEPKAFVRFGVHPIDNRRLDLIAHYEQSHERVRIRFYTDSRLKLGLHRLQFNNELEIRRAYGDAVGPGDAFLYGATRARLDFEMGGGFTQFWSARVNVVDFDSSGDLSHNQVRLAGYAGLSRTFDDFSTITAMFFLGSRTVPDSSRLDYVSYGFESSLLKLYNSGDLDLTVRVERKDYNQPNDESDFTRWELLGRHKIEFADNWLARQEIDIEYSNFSDSDLVNADYLRSKLHLQAGRRIGDFHLWAGPQVELLVEAQTDLISAADYTETALRLDIDYMSFRSIYGSLEWSAGVRNLRFDDEFQSDFWFQRLTVLGDARLVGGMGFNILSSIEWEWHDEQAENNRLYLLSGSITYDF